MAKIREDLEGTVLALSDSSATVFLKAGEEIPDGYFVGGHLLEDGDPSEQSPPWASSAPAEVETVQEHREPLDPVQEALDNGESPEDILEAIADRLGLAILVVPKDDGAGDDSSDATGSSDATMPALPPRGGAGSGADAWRAYSVAAAKVKGFEIDIPADATKTDIIEALKSVDIPVE